MPTSSRVSVRKAPKSRVASSSAKTRRKISRKPRKAAATVPTEINPFLIAQFEEALGGISTAPRKARKGKGKSLRDALEGAASSQSVFAAMPGVRIEVPIAATASTADILPAPCVAVHRRHRVRARLAHAASYCFAILVSAGIIGATAYGIASQAPRGDHATLALNAPAKAPSL